MPRVFFSFSIILGTLFLFFSYLVSQELFTQFDFDITVKIQNHISRQWDAPFTLLSLLGSAEITGLIWLGLLLWATFRKLWLTVGGLFLLVGAQIVEIFGKLLLFHPSPPFMFYRGVKIITFPSHFVQTDYSYPSGHSMRTTFLVVFLFLLFAYKLGGIGRVLAQGAVVLFLFAMLVSRVYLGEHWATDVVGGALLGGGVALLVAATLPVKQFTSQT